MVEDRNLPVDKIYCADGMHGGVAVVLYGVDEVVTALLNKRKVEPSYKFYLELDGYTFEDWIRNPTPVKDNLKQAVKDGWVEIVNGAYTQPFAENIGLESNIRQLQWGRLLAQRALETNIETYLVQEHAFHVALPQILLQLGYKSAVLRTHWPIWGQHKSYPYQSFYWIGADGSKILTVPHYSFLHFGRVPRERPHLETWIKHERPYLETSMENWIEPPSEENIKRWLTECEKLGIDKPLASRDADLIFPHILKDETLRKIGKDSRLQFVTPREYTQLVKASTTVEEYVDSDDMDTTLPFGLGGDRIIAGSKKIENKLLAAEKFSTVAYLLAGRPFCNPYRMNLGGGQHYEDDLRFAWRKLLLAEQHDIWVGGPTAFADSTLEERGLRWLREAEAICDEILAESMVQILFCVKFNLSLEKAAPIAVFNPLPWSRTDVVEVNLQFRKRDFDEITMQGPDGRAVPTQIVKLERYEDGSIAKALVVFVAREVPGTGYKVYYAVEQGERVSTDLEASESRVENSNIIMTLNARGITGIALKGKQRQLIAEDRTAARLVAFQGDDRLCMNAGQNPGQLRLVEKGPVRAKYEIVGSSEIFNFCKMITVHAYIPRIDVEDQITIPEPVFIGHHTKEETDPPEKRKGWYTDVFIEAEKLRSVIPLAITDEHVRHNTVYVSSETNHEAFSGYDWADVSGQEKGLTLINRGNFRYYYDSIRKELSLVLGYSGTFVYSSGPEFHMMKGNYSFSYALYPHEAFKSSLVNRAALEANNPLIVCGFKYFPLISKDMAKRIEAFYKELEKLNRPLLPEEFSFLRVEAASGNISTMCLEKGLPVIRLYEDSGEKADARIFFFEDLQAAEVIDLRGNVLRRLDAKNGFVNIALNPYEIITMRLKLASRLQPEKLPPGARFASDYFFITEEANLIHGTELT